MSIEARIGANWGRVYLKPTEMHLSDGSPQAVTTVLGSCVSVTFFAPEAGVGGITHGMLPREAAGQAGVESGRFVDSGIAWMVRAFARQGFDPGSLEVKLFGGAQMHETDASSRTTKSVGRQNVESALETIEELGLRLLVSEVGGSWGRKLVFFPHSGDVWIKKITRSSLYNGETHGQAAHTRHGR